MRGCALIAVIVIAGCDEATPLTADAEIDAKPTRIVPTLPMNIVVTDHSVQVYTEALDLPYECVVTNFPTYGHCTTIGDGGMCNEFGGPTCFTDMGIELDGQRLAPDPRVSWSADPWTFAFESPFGQGKLELVVAGCGHPSTRIALDGPPVLDVQATAVVENGDAHVTWTTDRPAMSALLDLWNGYYGGICHVEGANEYTFKLLTVPAHARVGAVEARIDIVTDFGPATIWRTGVGGVSF